MDLAAAKLALILLRLPIRTPTDIPGALDAATRTRSEALVVVDDALVTKHQIAIVGGAMKRSLPVLSEYKPFVEAGGLLAYGPSTIAMYRRAAHYIDRILRGTRPNDLPTEQPTKFDLFVNLTTAKVLGLTIPPSLLARADHILQ